MAGFGFLIFSGFIFVFVFFGLYLNTAYKIHKARVFQIILIATVGFGYLILSMIQAFNPMVILFLLGGIVLILASFLKYQSNLKEMNPDDEENDYDQENDEEIDYEEEEYKEPKPES